MSAKRRRKVKRQPGDVLQIDLGGGHIAFGRVCTSTVAFYDLRVTEVPSGCSSHLTGNSSRVQKGGPIPYPELTTKTNSG